MRDWQRSLRRASFRGVPFWVESDGNETGRRVAVHEVSGGDTIITEDMGRRARSVYVSAYVIGDVADGKGHAIEAACVAPNAALLVLPIDPARSMHCLSCRRARYRDRAGYIAYDLEFVESGAGGPLGSSGLGSMRDIFSAGAAAVVTALSSFRI
ncbi:DNA circularization N-terminal domain-containing protein [Mesorhizobium sp. CAU 1732]|uniref:DNA circularization N-terminal domain-containing protein n=1 Tax=Mesorhizobium sp. CAU 1732 TaxID=3140358 RepID=UPI003260EE62